MKTVMRVLRFLVSWVIPHAIYMREWRKLARHSIMVNGRQCNAVAQDNKWILVEYPRPVIGPPICVAERGSDWIAWYRGNGRVWECGKTQEEAVGNLMVRDRKKNVATLTEDHYYADCS